MSRITIRCGAMVLMVAALGAWGSGCAAAADVRVYEGTREILTGPFELKGRSPQQRLNQFKPVKYPCVFIENEYFRCCVLPTVGGRLYEVYNKASKSQVFFVNPYLETYADDFEGAHPWNLGGVEVNFPYFHHGNTYNDRWQWAADARPDGAAGVAMSFTSRPSMQRATFRVLLRPGVARVDLEYRFENLNPYCWGLAAWIDTMHPKTMDTQFILPSPWVAQHGYNRGRTDLKSWPIRDGIDISWQKNLPPKGDLSEFAFMPREHFHGCYDHALDRGAARVFDPRTLPAAKLWTQVPPVTPEQYYQHFEIWTATSAVMEDPVWQAELSSYAAGDSWQQVWGIGGYVLANEDLAMNLARVKGGKLLAGVCGTRKLPGCVVSVRRTDQTLLRRAFDLDPAQPWRGELPDGGRDVTMEVFAPGGAVLARYELRDPNALPKEQWQMPAEPRWQKGVNSACYEEGYSPLWRRPDQFLDEAIRDYAKLLKDAPAGSPQAAELAVALARSHLKDEQVRIGAGYRKPGPEADADAAKRREADLAKAVELLEGVLKAAPAGGAAGTSATAQASLYLGLALERQGKRADAIAAYRAACRAGSPLPAEKAMRDTLAPAGGAFPAGSGLPALRDAPATAAGVWLARLVMTTDPAEAVALAQRAAKQYPQSTRARHVLLAALLAAGTLDQAADVGAKLLALDPTDPLTTRLLADLAAKAGRAVDAKMYADLTARLLVGDEKAAQALEADLRWVRGL